MGDNGKEEIKKEEPIIKTEEQIKKETDEANKPKVVFQLIMHPSGEFEFKTTLIPPMLIWIMEQVKFNVLKANAENQNKVIQPAKGSMLNFARKIFR